MKTIIKASYIPQIIPFISNVEARYYLNGVFIEPDATGVRMVATDGHALGAFHDDAGLCDNANIWPISKALVKACTPARKDRLTRWLVLDGTRAVVVFAGNYAEADTATTTNDPTFIAYQEFTKPIDGTFPDYRRVIPGITRDFEPTHTGSYASKVLAQCFVAAGYHADGTKGAAQQSVAIHHQANNGPAIVKISGRPDFLGVLMPMRCEQPAAEPTLPDWIAKGEQQPESHMARAAE